MYQVLYRKWRPKVFDDVIGQEHVTRTLKNEVISKHIAHAYLFTGTRGTGKTSCAKIFSLAVNCENPENGNPCGECHICKESANGALLDVSEIDAASNTGVENIRSIKEETFLVPTLCKYRVYIIDEAHMLSTQAFNAFLKILEEPPEHVIFILATTEPNKIPATILSRCQRFEFNRISQLDIANRIEYICTKESVKITNDAAKVIADVADGAMRDALSLLDRCVSCGEDNLDSDKVRNILGITDKESVELIFRYIMDKNAGKALELVEYLHDKSKNMIGLCEELLEKFRCTIIEQVSIKNIDKKLDYLLLCAEFLRDTYKKMITGCDARLEIELAITRLCCGDLNSLGEVEQPKIKLISQTDKNLKVNKKENSDIDSSDLKNLDTELNVENLENEKIGSEESIELDEWPQVIEVIKQNARSKSMMLAFKGSKAYKKGDFILIASDKDLAFELLRDSANRDEMRNAIKLVTGKMYKLGPYKKSEHAKDKMDSLDEFIQKTRNQGINIGIK